MRNIVVDTHLDALATRTSFMRRSRRMMRSPLSLFTDLVLKKNPMTSKGIMEIWKWSHEFGRNERVLKTNALVFSERRVPPFQWVHHLKATTPHG